MDEMRGAEAENEGAYTEVSDRSSKLKATKQFAILLRTQDY